MSLLDDPNIRMVAIAGACVAIAMLALGLGGMSRKS